MDQQAYGTLLARAKEVMPGGMNTNIRDYPADFVVSKADGAYLWDQNGKKYIDYLASWGPIIAGYDNKEIKAKAADALARYDLYGIGVTEVEVALAEKLCSLLKGMERVLLCNGGSDATFHALRLARASTGREKIVKMQGGFHGWHDYVLMNVMSQPEKAYKLDLVSAGMLRSAAEKTLICRYNDLEHFRETCRKNRGEIAAVIVDPCNSPFGCIKMHDDYARGLRSICDEEGIILIFDEVVTGFRVALRGAVSLFDITPDLLCIGKGMANGFPVAAVGGRAELMNHFNTNPGGTVSYQATYYGHPLLAAAALATIEVAERPGFYEHMSAVAERLCKGLEAIAGRKGVPFCTEHRGGLIGLFWGEGPFSNYDELVAGIDQKASDDFRRRMIDRGYYFPIGPFKRLVTMNNHTEADIDETLAAAEAVFAML